MTRNTLLLSGFILAVVIGVVVYGLSGSSASTRPSASSAARPHPQVHHITTPIATVPVAPPTTTTTTTNPQVEEQTAITQDQAAVASDDAAVAQDSSTIQALTAQQQTVQSARQEAVAQQQAQVQQLENSGQATAANLANVSQQYQATNNASLEQLTSLGTSLNAAGAKYQQDESNLAAAGVALQVAQDVAK
jgi:hypothetical protein